MNEKEARVQVIDWKPQWSTGATSSFIIADSWHTFLMYAVAEIGKKDKNGFFEPEQFDPWKAENSFALVEFEHCIAHKFGIANDEVHYGLPLYERGLEHYSAHTVENSTWLDEIKQINKVHPMYN